jgi:dTDP-4-dehydrorhamnose reductase
MKILVIGGSGFLGSKIMDSLCGKFSLIGTFHSRSSRYLIYFDLADRSLIKQVQETYQPDLVIHCGGITRPDLCETRKDIAWSVNVLGTVNLVSALGNTKIIYFSSDYVFDGGRGNYAEDDTPNPVNYYGLTKLASEMILLGANEDNVVLRVSGLYGYNKRNNEFLESLTQSDEIVRPDDCFSTHTLIDDIAECLPFFFEKSGVYHVSGPESMSRYEFTSRAVRLLGMKTRVVRAKAEEIYRQARRPRNSSLISTRHRYKMLATDDGLRVVRNQMLQDGVRMDAS